MKYAGILAFPFLFSSLAHAGVAEKYHGSVSAGYAYAEADDVTSDSWRGDLRWYPKGIVLNPNLPAFEIDQLNPGSYVSAGIADLSVDAGDAGLSTTTQSLGGRLVLWDRRLFLSGEIGDISGDGDTVAGDVEAEGDATLLSVGVRLGKLITSFTHSEVSTDTRAFVGTVQPTFYLVGYAYSQYTVINTEQTENSIGLSWVDRTGRGRVYLIEANLYQQREDATASSELIETYTDPVTGAVDDDELYSATELGRTEKDYLGMDVSVTYYPQRDFGITAGWSRLPQTAPQLSVGASVFVAERFVLSPEVAFGEDSYELTLDGEIRF